MRIVAGTVLIAAVLLAGCRSVPPLASGPAKLRFQVYVDANTKNVTHPVQKRRQENVAAWMAQDCANLIRKAGSDASVIRDVSAVPTGSDDCLLKIKLENYKWRFVGTTMDASYVLTRGGKEILASRSGCGTSRNWRRCCRKINTEIIDAIRSALN